ncbi:hypothetical protein PCIT_a0325 [Pseudoalteromonas citrea]|uniref:Amidohydrolase 3 domain-containing protein n=2 Tax=Pseudoalteromonas citrea TaxID=43655 RepID=A0AAD4FSX0_9GAMM|nr:amidohydrolase family protein [Pseudoalteromonas citrea]KAF7773966.1 hypothetical protein PCIT_a0325 [Pseudoalteromonas citrea]
MNDIQHKQQGFSLDHLFFDGLLDKLGEYLPKTPMSITLNNNSERYTQGSPHHRAHIIHGGKVYSHFGEFAHYEDAMAVYNGKVLALGTLDEVRHRVYQMGFIATFYRLKPNEVVTPGFIEPHCHLVTSAVLQQWFHFGPFGFHCRTCKFMDSYNISYVLRSVLYLDKAIKDKQWLLGYGLYSSLLSSDDVSDVYSVYKALRTIAMNRPVVIFDAQQPLAFVNTAALELLYKYLARNHVGLFKNKQHFFTAIEKQGGLKDEQLLWILEVLPVRQLQQFGYALIQNIDNLLTHAKEQGITHLGYVDSHPVALNLLSTYSQRTPKVHLVNTIETWINASCNYGNDLGLADISKAVIDNSIALNIGDVGYLGFDWVQSYHGEQTLTPCQSLLKQGVNVCLQSGFPMLPLSPLRNAQQATTREMEYAPHCYMAADRTLDKKQCFTRLQSMRSISSAAASHLKIHPQAGHLFAGGRANYLLLSDDPLHCSDLDMRRIHVVHSSVN